MLQRWSQYLNMCMPASSSELLEAPGASIPFSFELILVDLEGGRYAGPILPGSLEDLLAGRRAAGGSGSGSGRGGGNTMDPSSGSGSSSSGRKPKNFSVGAAGGGTRVHVQYDAHLPALFLWDGDKSWTLLVGTVLHTLHVHILLNNWHMYGVCW